MSDKIVVKRVTISVIGVDTDGKPKHVALDVADLQECLPIVSPESQKTLAALNDLGMDLLTDYDDAHKLVVDKNNAVEELGAAPAKAAQTKPATNTLGKSTPATGGTGDGPDATTDQSAASD